MKEIDVKIKQNYWEIGWNDVKQSIVFSINHNNN